MPAYNPPPPARYIDPLVDFAFKKIFGSEPNKDLLIAFLNEVFEGRKQVVDLSYNPTEHPGDGLDEGGVIFDLNCTGSKGESFIIEIQRGRQLYFKERALFYTSRLISSQAPKGETGRWKYDLKEVYLIALLEKTTLEDSPADEYLHNVRLSYVGSGQPFYDKLGFTYIELSKFTKPEVELETDLQKWLYILKNMSRMDKLPVYLRKPIFEKLFQIAEYTNLSKEERLMYDTSLKYKWDNENVREYEIEEAIKATEERVRREDTFVTAQKMKNLGFSAQQIAAVTGLSEEEIGRL